MLDPKTFPKLRGAVTYVLDSGVELHRQSPETFQLPSARTRRSLKPGDLVKLVFRLTDGRRVCVERMWVIVHKATEKGYVGELNNDPYSTKKIQAGMIVEFTSDHVIAVDRNR